MGKTTQSKSISNKVLAKILKDEPILSEKEAKELSRYTRALRKERWFKS